MSAREDKRFLRKLKYKFAKYFAVFKINFSEQTAYLVNFFSRGSMVVIRVWIFTELYKISYLSLHKEQINNLTVPMVIWILMLAQSFQGATRPHIARLIEEDVKTGNIIYSLNKPHSYFLFHYFSFLGRTLPVLLLNISLGTLATLIFVGGIHLSGIGLYFGSILLLGGYTLHFLISFSIGILAFWTEDISAFIWIYQKAQFIFGGVILPLALFPQTMQKVTQYLPFSQLFYSAAQIIITFDFHLFQRFLFVQATWIVLLGTLVFYLFYASIKYVSINGG